MSNNRSSAIDREHLDPSAIADYISFNGCPQYHKYTFDSDVRSQARKQRNWTEAFEGVNILLSKDGNDFEKDCIEQLQSHSVDMDAHTTADTWEKSQTELHSILQKVQTRSPGDPPIIGTQTKFGDKIEAWPVYGDADVVVFWPGEDDTVRIRIIDIKASYDEKTYQQIQVGIYTILLRKFLEANNLADITTVEGGIWTREDEITGVSPVDLPKFNKLESRESDVRRLLKAGGEFDRWYTADNDDVNYQLGAKCNGCEYREVCYSNSIEDASLALLGLSRGEQKKFEEHGITTLHSLAELAYTESDPKPYEYKEINSTDDTKYKQLLDEPGIGERLPRYIQKAQAMLSQITDNSMFSSDGKEAEWLLGAGDGSLPDDEYSPQNGAELPYENRSMIRTYIHVQRDHRRDRVTMASAYVTSSLYEDAGYDPIKVSKLSDEIPDDEQQAEQVEQDLLTDFFTELFTTIQDIGKKMGHPKKAPVHLYFYTHQEKDALVESVKRNRTLKITPAIRDLLGLRQAIKDGESNHDQPMVSVVRPEIEARKCPTTPNTGLLPMVDDFYPQQNFFPNDAWEYTRSDGVDVDLRDAFSSDLFNFNVPYKQDGEFIKLFSAGEDTPDGFYPSRIRFGADIPLEYIWSAQGKITDAWIDSAAEGHTGRKEQLEPFRWHDSDTKTHRILPEDVEMLGKNFAHCLAHIERGFQYQSADAAMAKRPFSLDRLDTFTLGSGSVVRAAKEFLDMEYHTQHSERLSHYARQPAQRVRTGESIPLVVKNVEEDGNDNIIIEGKLVYSGMFDSNIDQIANSCRQKGGDGSTSGSWMIANELDRAGNAVGDNKPWELERGVGVTISTLDIDNREIKLQSRKQPMPAQDFVSWHNIPVTSRADAEEDNHVLIEPGKILILDPRADDLLAQRSHDILSKPANNFVAQSVQQMIDGTLTTPETTVFPKPAIEEFVDWMVAGGLGNPPNEKQREFMLENTGQFSLLQGPPGTGKTSFAMAPAILSRVYSFATRDMRFSGFVGGESNKAVDELLEDVADAHQTYVDSDHTDLLDDVKLVRLVSDAPEDKHPNVEYLNYHKDLDAVDEVLEHLKASNRRRQQSLGDYDANVRKHVIVFGTPSRLYSLLGKMDRTMETSMSPEDLVENNHSYFDLMAVDEASMMRLPSFLMCGAFVEDHAQILVGGDQRQMPPVATHDWENEDRRIIEEFVPYLSTLDYLRMVGGQDVDSIHKPDEAVTASATIPMTQLELTYRCHLSVANFLQRHVYAQDNIAYRSMSNEKITRTTPKTEALEHVLDPDQPLVLVLHDDDTNQQANPEEAALAMGIVDDIDPTDSTGIVTPHNAQRGILSNQLPKDTEVDTVERFQGGERDMILVSATASDPDFLESESDFILNPNRLNVAMSRMKKKLVVVASQEVFNLVPPDIEKYNHSLLWKGLYEDMEVNANNPDWEGTLDEFTPSGATSSLGVDPDTNVQVFTLGSDL